MRGINQHDFFQLMGSVKEDLGRDYLRIRSRSREDPGTAGDQAEEDWAAILRQWMPANYHIATKGRILFDDQTSSPQVDVLILKPSYPLGLRNQKYYFSGGIVAAFECKLTARMKDIRAVFKTASMIKRKLKPRYGTPYGELQTSISFGLLAHSHELAGKDRVHSLYDAIQKNQVKFAEHPRELPDLFCVADAATVPLTVALLRPSDLPENELEGIEEFAGSLLVDTMYVIHDEKVYDSVARTGSILATLVKDLTRRIAYSDPSIRDWAEHLSALGSYLGIGLPQYWSEDVFSSAVRASLSTMDLREGAPWSEWSKWLY